jgi:hypothetical protein
MLRKNMIVGKSNSAAHHFGPSGQRRADFRQASAAQICCRSDIVRGSHIRQPALRLAGD